MLSHNKHKMVGKGNFCRHKANQRNCCSLLGGQARHTGIGPHMAGITWTEPPVRHFMFWLEGVAWLMTHWMTPGVLQ